MHSETHRTRRTKLSKRKWDAFRLHHITVTAEVLQHLQSDERFRLRDGRFWEKRVSAPVTIDLTATPDGDDKEEEDALSSDEEQRRFGTTSPSYSYSPPSSPSLYSPTSPSYREPTTAGSPVRYETNEQ